MDDPMVSRLRMCCINAGCRFFEDPLFQISNIPTFPSLAPCYVQFEPLQPELFSIHLG